MNRKNISLGWTATFDCSRCHERALDNAPVIVLVEDSAYISLKCDKCGNSETRKVARRQIMIPSNEKQQI